MTAAAFATLIVLLVLCAGACLVVERHVTRRDPSYGYEPRHARKLDTARKQADVVPWQQRVLDAARSRKPGGRQ